MRLRASILERRAIWDVMLAVGAVMTVSVSVHYFDLHYALAQWTGLALLAEINPTLWIIVYTMWVLSIFVLRRMEDIYALLKHRTVFEQQTFSERKHAYLAGMAGGVVHDLNNVLTTIRGFSEVAQIQVGGNHPAAESLRGAIDATGRATHFLRLLTDFADNEDQPIELMQLASIVRGMEPVVRYLIKDGDIQLKFEIDEEAGWTRISRTQIEEVVLNLCMNAVQAMSGRQGQLVFRVDRMTLVEDQPCGQNVARAGDYVRLSISDTGRGIDSKIHKSVFDPYFTTKAKGCGLGLTLVRRFVEGAGGFVKMTSVKDEGSKFTVCLPCADRTDMASRDFLIA